MDPLGTKRTTSAVFVPASVTNLLSEFSSLLALLSLGMKTSCRPPRFMGMMIYNQATICKFAAWLQVFSHKVAVRVAYLTIACKNLITLGVFFLEMRSCFHPPCCFDGQLRHSGTVEHLKIL